MYCYGLYENDFKARYYNYKHTLRNDEKACATKLSKHTVYGNVNEIIWTLLLTGTSLREQNPDAAVQKKIATSAWLKSSLSFDRIRNAP